MDSIDNEKVGDVVKGSENPFNALSDALKSLNDSLTRVNNLMQNNTASLGALNLKSIVIVNDIITKAAITENYLLDASRILSSSIIVPPPPPPKQLPATQTAASQAEVQAPVWSDKEVIEAAMARARKEQMEREKGETALASTVSAISTLRMLSEEYNSPAVFRNVVEEEPLTTSTISKGTEDDKTGVVFNKGAQVLDTEPLMSHQKAPANQFSVEKDNSTIARPTIVENRKSNYRSAVASLAMGISVLQPQLPVSISVGNTIITPPPPVSTNTTRFLQSDAASPGLPPVAPPNISNETGNIPEGISGPQTGSTVSNEEDFTDRTILSRKELLNRDDVIPSLKKENIGTGEYEGNPPYQQGKVVYTEPISEARKSSPEKSRTTAVGMLAAMAFVPSAVSAPLKEGVQAFNPLLPVPQPSPPKEEITISTQKKSTAADEVEYSETTTEHIRKQTPDAGETTTVSSPTQSASKGSNNVSTNVSTVSAQVEKSTPSSSIISPTQGSPGTNPTFSNARTSIAALTGFGLMGALAGGVLLSNKATAQILPGTLNASNTINTTTSTSFTPASSFAQPPAPQITQTAIPVSQGSNTYTSITESTSSTASGGLQKGSTVTESPPEYIHPAQSGKDKEDESKEYNTKPLLTGTTPLLDFRTSVGALSAGMMFSLFMPGIKPAAMSTTMPPMQSSSNTPAIGTPEFKDLSPEYPVSTANTGASDVHPASGLPYIYKYSYQEMLKRSVYPAISSLYQVSYFTDPFTSPNTNGTTRYPSPPQVEAPLTPSALNHQQDNLEELEHSALTAIQSVYSHEEGDKRPVGSSGHAYSISQSFGQNFYSIVRMVNEIVNPIYRQTPFTASEPAILNYGISGTENIKERNLPPGELYGKSLTTQYPPESTMPYFQAVRKLEDVSDYGQPGTSHLPHESLSAFNFREGYFGSLYSLWGLTLSSNLADGGNTVKLLTPMHEGSYPAFKPVIRRAADEEPLVNMRDTTLPQAEFPKYIDYSTPVSRISTYKEIYNRTISKVVQPMMNMQQMISNPNILNQTNLLTSSEVSNFTRFIKNDFYPQILSNIVMNQPVSLETRSPLSRDDKDNDISLAKGDAINSLIRTTSNELTESSIGAMTIVGRLITRAFGLKDIDYTTPPMAKSAVTEDGISTVQMAKSAVTEDGISTPVMSRSPPLLDGISTLKMAKSAVTEDGISTVQMAKSAVTEDGISTPVMSRSPPLLDGISTLKMAKSAVTEDGISTPAVSRQARTADSDYTQKMAKITDSEVSTLPVLFSMYNYRKHLNTSIVGAPMRYTKITNENIQPAAGLPDIQNEIRLLKAMIQRQNTKLNEMAELLNQSMRASIQHEGPHVSNVYNVTIQSEGNQNIVSSPQEIDMDELAEKIRRIISQEAEKYGL